MSQIKNTGDRSFKIWVNKKSKCSNEEAISITCNTIGRVATILGCS